MLVTPASIPPLRVSATRSGTTLVELAFALVLIAIFSLLASTSFASARNVLAVRGARDAIIAASARTRAFAIGHGGATLTLDATAGTMRIRTRDNTIDEVSAMTRSIGVRLQFDAAQTITSVTIPYDALGIGRLANRTITLQRDRVVGGVTFSAYGRPRPW